MRTVPTILNVVIVRLGIIYKFWMENAIYAVSSFRDVIRVIVRMCVRHAWINTILILVQMNARNVHTAVLCTDVNCAIHLLFVLNVPQCIICNLLIKNAIIVLIKFLDVYIVRIKLHVHSVTLGIILQLETYVHFVNLNYKDAIIAIMIQIVSYVELVTIYQL